MYLRYKKIQDITLSATALIILMPLLLIIGLLIFLDDPYGGSPIYIQKRIGKNGRPFNIYKFRTMKKDADKALKELKNMNEMDGPVFKIKNDPRITRFGKLLRQTSLDELPQLWNIIRGDMSIVGPRPALENEVLQYNSRDRERLDITPGLTCYWQIQPNRNEITFRDWINFDLKYKEDISFITDWKIILKTFKAIFLKYGV